MAQASATTDKVMLQSKKLWVINCHKLVQEYQFEGSPLAALGKEVLRRRSADEMRFIVMLLLRPCVLTFKEGGVQEMEYAAAIEGYKSYSATSHSI